MIPAVRYLRRILFIPGVSVGFYPTFFFILVTMAPYALLVGYVLPYSLAVMRTFRADVSGYQTLSGRQPGRCLRRRPCSHSS